MDNQHQNRELKKKCHGNRRDQRFRRKCRQRGMKPLKIQQLLHKNKSLKKKISRAHQYMRETALDSSNQASNQSEQSTTINLNKRKRNISLQELKANSVISKSLSSISLLQSLTKKKKERHMSTTTMPIIEENDNNFLNQIYRQPMYLKRSPWILFQTLSNKLNYPLNEKRKQEYIYKRLNLFDQKFCLEVHLQLCESFLAIGSKEHHWPEQFRLMSETDDFQLCCQYLTNYIEQLKEQINQCESELITQINFHPIIPITFNQVDDCLKEYVDHQRKYLLTKSKNELATFQDDIQANKLYQTIMNSYPNWNQDQFICQLIGIRRKQIEIWEQLLQLEMRVLCNFLPPDCDHLQNTITLIDYVPLNNQRKTIELNNKRYKVLQCAKRQWLQISLSIYETKLQEYDHEYEDIILQLESVLSNNTSLQCATLLNDVNRFVTYRTNQLRQSITSKMSAFRSKLIQRRQQVSLNKSMIGVLSEPYLDLISHPFNALEWKYLSLGPSYIRPNQSAIRPRKQQEIEIKHEHKEICSKIQNNLVEYHHVPRTHPIHQEYSDQLRNYLNNCYLAPLPYKDHIEAREQSQITASIRYKMKQAKLIIRVTDKSNNFYIGSVIEFEKKVQQYFMDTNAFVQITENPLPEILNKVIHLLNNLRSKKLILKWQYDETMPDQKTVELAHLYFNPKTHKDGIPLRPIQNTIHAPTTNISKFLDRILRPIFEDKCIATTIIDGAHLLTAMKTYVNKGLMKSSTLFCTFDIHNLYTMLPQDEALNILVEFLHVHGYRKVKGIPLDAIRKLASIVIKENVFVYGNKIYKQTTGGAMGSSFTLTLANIFMWKWQKELVRYQDITGEFFGRYIDDVFMTWNKSERELKKLLGEANQWHSNIKLDYKISQSLAFLDILLTNNNGILSTSVYHKPSAEPYVVPFNSDHPRHIFVNIIRNSLTRAVRYSSTFEAFSHERRSIKLMLLYNGYPSSFIDQQFQKFFHEFVYATSILSFIENEQQFLLLRHEILDQLTPQQSQAASRAALADVDNDQTDITAETTSRETVRKIQRKTISHADQLFLCYTHEKRFQPVKRNIHQVYGNVFKNTPAMDLKLIVGSRNRRDAKNELIKKRPKRSLLQCKQILNKYKKMLERRKE